MGHVFNSRRGGARRGGRGSAGGARAEALEQRTLLAFVPVGPGFRVDDPAGTTDRGGPSVASDADGDFVIAWQAHGATDWDVYAQRYNAGGVPQGASFRVNATTAGDQHAPAAAMDADGDFVVVWQSNRTGGSDIHAQRYNAAGAPQGAEFKVNTFTSDGSNTRPAVAASADGSFV